ncbi:MAG: dockerin type I repeat-containing protein [Spirochaetales bacterium]|nr:dockerin type I repeat-containing protein [Spirochaetales bacterium]
MSMKQISLMIVLVAMILGPSLIFAQASQNYDWDNVQIVGGGFVPGIIYNESEKGLVYARTDIGGAYRLDRSTMRWVPLLDFVGWDNWNLSGVISLASDPVEPRRLYAACGSYTNEWDPDNGAILASDDYGATWNVVRMPFKIGGNMPGRGGGERLAIDPNDNSIIYFGAQGDAEGGFGLWRSINYGSSWSKVNTFPNAGTYIDKPDETNSYLTSVQGIYWVVFDPNSGTPGSGSKTIYAGVGDVNGNCIYRSTDAGVSWSLVPGQITSIPCPHQGKIDHVNKYLYVAYSNNGGPYDGTLGDLARLDLSTDTWLIVSPVENNGVPSDGDNYFGYSGLALDRSEPGTLMVTAYSSWWPDTQIYRSKDSGLTWTKIWDWVSYPERSFRYTHDISASPWLYWGGTAVEPEVSPKLGWMTEALAINPFDSDEMMYGTGATIYGTSNLTAWDAEAKIKIRVMAEGLEETAIQTICSPPEGAEVLSGMYDVYGFAHFDVTKVPDAFYSNPMIATTGIDYAEEDPSFIFRVGAGGAELNYIVQQYSGTSTDGGKTWNMNWNSPSGITGGGSVAVGASGRNILWSPEGTGVHYSNTGGSNWFPSTGVPQGAAIASDRVNSNLFYAVSGTSLYVSTDGGQSFKETVANLPTSTEDKFRVKAVRNKEGHIWLAGGDMGLYRSVDKGTTVTKLSNVEAAASIGFGAPASGSDYQAVFTAAKIDGIRGVYRSDDAGASWIRINDDQHQWAWIGKDISGDPKKFGRVYIATNGRGLIYGDPSGGTVTILPTPTPTPGPMCELMGDANSDGVVNIVDALLSAQYYVKITVDININCADVNCSGDINIVDALLIAQFYVKIIDRFDC